MDLSGTITIPSLPQGCFTSIAALIKFINQNGTVKLALPNGTVVSFGTTDPGVEFHGYPWIKTDAGGSPLGTYIWSTRLAAWVRDWGAALGEIRTVFRTEETVSLDRIAKGMTQELGWEICDGTGLSGLDFRSSDKDVIVAAAVTGGGGGNVTATIKVPLIRGFFSGDANLPITTNWDYYTVLFTGY